MILYVYNRSRYLLSGLEFVNSFLIQLFLELFKIKSKSSSVIAIFLFIDTRCKNVLFVQLYSFSKQLQFFILYCEFLHAFSKRLLVKMIWYTENKCRVSLHCEFLHVSSNRLFVQRIWDTANNCRVSLHCEFLHASLKHLHVQMI